MQSVCSKCKTLNPTTSKFCARCGASLAGATLVQPVSSAPMQATSPAPALVEPAAKGRASPFAVLATLVLCIVLFFVVKGCFSGGSSTPKTHGSLDAWVAAQLYVESRLVSPSTAKFPCCYDDFAKHVGNGRYEIVSYVDSQNKLGATLRTYFTAVVQWTGEDDYSLVSLDFVEP